jgi:hypothetical protein
MNSCYQICYQTRRNGTTQNMTDKDGWLALSDLKQHDKGQRDTERYGRRTPHGTEVAPRSNVVGEDLQGGRR